MLGSRRDTKKQRSSTFSSLTTRTAKSSKGCIQLKFCLVCVFYFCSALWSQAKQCDVSREQRRRSELGSCCASKSSLRVWARKRDVCKDSHWCVYTQAREIVSVLFPDSHATEIEALEAQFKKWEVNGGLDEWKNNTRIKRQVPTP